MAERKSRPWEDTRFNLHSRHDRPEVGVGYPVAVGVSVHGSEGARVAPVVGRAEHVRHLVAGRLLVAGVGDVAVCPGGIVEGVQVGHPTHASVGPADEEQGDVGRVLGVGWVEVGNVIFLNFVLRMF